MKIFKKKERITIFLCGFMTGDVLKILAKKTFQLSRSIIKKLDDFSNNGIMVDRI